MAFSFPPPISPGTNEEINESNNGAFGSGLEFVPQEVATGVPAEIGIAQ
jgi:hypothetical protein